METKLSTGRKVVIKEMTIDQIDACKDMVQIVFVGDDAKTIKNLAQARTAWIRAGLAGGEFKDWDVNASKTCPDNVIKQLTDTEKEELAMKIQEAQVLGESKPSQ
tara:strand:- start:1031 stop:1345 length:315 start_codon:yes stop_codon:yes gene_type:complete